MFRDEHKDRASIKGYVPAILSWPLTACSSVASRARSRVFAFIPIILLWICLMTFWTHDNFYHGQLREAVSSTASLCSAWESISFCLSGKCHFSPCVIVVGKPVNHPCLFFSSAHSCFCITLAQQYTREYGSSWVRSHRRSRVCTRWSSEKQLFIKVWGITRQKGQMPQLQELKLILLNAMLILHKGDKSSNLESGHWALCKKKKMPFVPRGPILCKIMQKIWQRNQPWVSGPPVSQVGFFWNEGQHKADRTTLGKRGGWGFKTKGPQTPFTGSFRMTWYLCFEDLGELHKVLRLLQSTNRSCHPPFRGTRKRERNFQRL